MATSRICTSWALAHGCAGALALMVAVCCPARGQQAGGPQAAPQRPNASRVAYRVRTVADPVADPVAQPAPATPAPAGPQAPPAPGTPAETPSPSGEMIMPGGTYEMPGGPMFGAAPVAAWPSEFDCPPINGCRLGVQCQQQGACYEMNWKATRPIPWQIFAQGEYIGPHRLRHVPEYRVRVDDHIFLLFRLTTDATAKPYELTVSDVLRVESLTSEDLNRDVIIQPDGTISLRLLGQVKVAGRTIADVRDDLEEQYKKYVRDPSISIAPIKLNSRLEELRASIDARQGFGGQAREVRVTPEGTIQLPGIGSVPAQGLTLMELKREIDTRYLTLVSGFDVTPLLNNRAPRYIYVVGEVKVPGRYELVGPTTIMQSIALAGGWNVGGNLDHVVVFRRDSCWQLMATKVEIHHALFGKRPCPADEIWLRDSDIVLVPKRPIKVMDDAIELIFTRGIYGAFPMNFSAFWALNNTGNVLP